MDDMRLALMKLIQDPTAKPMKILGGAVAYCERAGDDDEKRVVVAINKTIMAEFEIMRRERAARKEVMKNDG